MQKEIKFLLCAVILIMVAASCATFPASVCMEYGGIRRETKNFVFCATGPIYDKNQRSYLSRFDDEDLPDAGVEF